MRYLHNITEKFLSFIFDRRYRGGLRKGRERLNNILLFAFFTIRRFRMSSSSLMASSLAFQLLISLIPLTVIFFSILSAYPFLYGEESRIKDFLFSHFLPASRDVIESYIENFSKKATTAGAIGFVFLIPLAVSMLGSLENSLNRIWGIERRRNLYERFSAFSFILIFSGVLIVLSFTISAKVSSYHLTERLLEIPTLRRILYLFFSYLFSIFAFFIAYIYLPYTKVRLAGALLGGFTCGVLWEASKNGFTLYVTRVVPYNAIYGSLGAVPIFLAWIYLTWVFFLFGGVITFVFQNFKVLREEEIFRRSEAEYTAFYGVMTMVLLTERFVEGGTPFFKKEIAERLGISDYLMEEILFRLSKARIIFGGEGKDLPVLPFIEPHNVTVGEVLRALSGEYLKVPSNDQIQEGIAEEGEKVRRIFREALTGSGSILERVKIGDLVQNSNGKEGY